MVGSSIDDYRIESELGRGGMGVVYKAFDTKLNRYVALKFLAEHLTTDPTSSDRFIREAQAAAALNHPSICSIHDIKTTRDDRTYIVMPNYEGQILSDILKAGALRPEKAIDYCLQTVVGLETAHSHGITHRDIKPGNLLVTDSGRVVILDFGLAKLQGETDLTKSESTVGTMAYMSPEQVQGSDVDHRTDIWALGVLLFEMLTGEKPFQGEFEAAVVYSVVNEDVDLDRDDIPDQLRPILAKLLSKDVKFRYQNMSDVHSALATDEDSHASIVEQSDPPKRTWLVPVLTLGVIALVFIVVRLMLPSAKDSVATGKNSVEISRMAVLPFVNIRADVESDYLGFALADQVIGSLSYFDGLVVRPASSIRQYENVAVDLQSVSRELDVDLVMTGSYIRENEVVRLTVELIDADSQTTVWRESIDAEYESTFRLQDEVADLVVNRLQIDLTGEEYSPDVPANPLAYDFYLKALAEPGTSAGRESAIALIQQSLSLDSTYAPAYDHLGLRLTNVGNYTLGGEEPIVLAEQALLDALRLNPNLLSAIGNLANLYTESGRIVESKVLADRMLEINANNAVAHFVRGYAFRYSGFIEESVREMRLAISLDSKNKTFRSAGITLYYAGQIEEAIDAFQIDSTSDYSLAWKGLIALDRGDTDKASEFLTRSSRTDPDGLIGLWSSALLSDINGDTDFGIEQLDRIMDTMPVDSEIWYHEGRRYCSLGAYEKCSQTLNHAVESGYFSPFHYENDPALTEFRKTEYFQPLYSKAWENHVDAAMKLGLEPREPGPYRDHGA